MQMFLCATCLHMPCDVSVIQYESMPSSLWTIIAALRYMGYLALKYNLMAFSPMCRSERRHFGLVLP
jgi:apolipoprotein N-acyltransferase